MPLVTSSSLLWCFSAAIPLSLSVSCWASSLAPCPTVGRDWPRPGGPGGDKPLSGGREVRGLLGGGGEEGAGFLHFFEIFHSFPALQTFWPVSSLLYPLVSSFLWILVEVGMVLGGS